MFENFHICVCITVAQWWLCISALFRATVVSNQLPRLIPHHGFLSVFKARWNEEESGDLYASDPAPHSVTSVAGTGHPLCHPGLSPQWSCHRLHWTGHSKVRLVLSILLLYLHQPLDSSDNSFHLSQTLDACDSCPSICATLLTYATISFHLNEFLDTSESDFSFTFIILFISGTLSSAS